ncbi:MAG TPA: condensation domain-containing protein [Kofleriaceae bacterium]|nr:condensation domain-containing protein [Kofleriaceae bacterium]
MRSHTSALITVLLVLSTGCKTTGGKVFGAASLASAVGAGYVLATSTPGIEDGRLVSHDERQLAGAGLMLAAVVAMSAWGVSELVYAGARRRARCCSTSDEPRRPAGTHGRRGSAAAAHGGIAQRSRCSPCLRTADEIRTLEALSPTDLPPDAPEQARLEAQNGLIEQAAPGDVFGVDDGVRQIALVPHQRWYLENFDPTSHVWVMAMCFDVPAAIDPQHLRSALGMVMRHHEALRLRLRRTDQGWSMVAVPDDGAIPFETVDLSSLPPGEREARFHDQVIAYHYKLSILTGPTIAMGLFHMSPDQPMRLLLTVHHSVEDNYSLYILFDDFLIALQEVAHDGPTSPLPGGPSYSEWSRYLMSFAESPALQSEMAYWLDDSRLRTHPLRTDRPRGPHHFGDSRWVRRQLSSEETAALHGLSARHRGVGIASVVLAGFARAYAAWAEQPYLRVDIEHHGRSPITPGWDFSRTLGGLTTKYPLVVPVDLEKDLIDHFEHTRVLLEEVPSCGIGYGLLRYCSEDETISARLRAVPPSDVFFDFLGNASSIQIANERFRPRVIPPFSDEQDLVSYLLLLSGRIEGGRLELEWMYSSALHDQATIERLDDDTMAELQLLAGRTSGLDGPRARGLE